MARRRVDIISEIFEDVAKNIPESVDRKYYEYADRAVDGQIWANVEERGAYELMTDMSQHLECPPGAWIKIILVFRSRGAGQGQYSRWKGKEYVRVYPQPCARRMHAWEQAFRFGESLGNSGVEIEQISVIIHYRGRAKAPETQFRNKGQRR